MTFEERLAQTAAATQDRLASWLDRCEADGCPARLAAAMRHAVLAGGKRFRPFLVLECASILGLDDEIALDTAAAIECLHAYSLVHDDLPAMDNDELRRGLPTVWKAFDEATAILAGDALLTLAFEILSTPGTHPDPAVRAELALGLAKAAGGSGMVGGQMLDLESESDGDPALHSLDGVLAIQRRKTGALIRFSAEAAAILARAGATQRAALVAYGDAVGAAFQIADDLLDHTGDSATTGKAVGKDADAGKATFVTVLGEDAARRRLAALQQAAHAHLAALGPATGRLAAAIEFVSARRS